MENYPENIGIFNLRLALSKNGTKMQEHDLYSLYNVATQGIRFQSGDF